MRKIILGACLLSASIGCSNEGSINHSNSRKEIESKEISSLIEQEKIKIIQSMNEILEQRNILIGGSNNCTITLQGNSKKKLVQANLACDGENILSVVDQKSEENIVENYIGGVFNIGVTNGQLNPHGACLRISHLIIENGKVKDMKDAESPDCRTYTI